MTAFFDEEIGRYVVSKVTSKLEGAREATVLLECLRDVDFAPKLLDIKSVSDKQIMLKMTFEDGVHPHHFATEAELKLFLRIFLGVSTNNLSKSHSNKCRRSTHCINAESSITILKNEMSCGSQTRRPLHYSTLAVQHSFPAAPLFTLADIVRLKALKHLRVMSTASV